MVSGRAYNQDFEAFFQPLEKIALGLKNNHIFSMAHLYHNLGLPQVALILYAQIDTPENLASLAAYNALGSVGQDIRLPIDPHNQGSIDDALQIIKEKVTISPEEVAKQVQLNAEAAGKDPSLVSNIEISVASARAVSYLRVGNAEEAIKQADRLSPFTNSVNAQYAAAMVYSSQVMTNKATAKLDEIARLAQQHQINFPDSSYFDAIRGTATLRKLLISSAFIGHPPEAPWAKLTKEQLAKLVERANILASERYESFIIDPLLAYMSRNADLGIERNDNTYLANAETAANKAVEILGMNADTATLLATVYNRTNRHEDAAKILLAHESSISAAALFELATALKLSGDNNGAFRRLEQALDAQPELVVYMDQKPYNILNQLSSQPGFQRLMIRTKITNNPYTS